MNHKEPLNLNTSLFRLLDLGLELQKINKILEVKYGLSIVQWSLLKNLLEMPAASPLALARSLKITPGTITQTLGRLSKKKFLFICEDPQDARKKMVSLTREGRDALLVVEQEYVSIFAEIDKIEGNIQEVDIFLKEKVKKRLYELDGIDFLEESSSQKETL